MRSDSSNKREKSRRVALLAAAAQLTEDKPEDKITIGEHTTDSPAKPEGAVNADVRKATDTTAHLHNRWRPEFY